MWLDVIFTVLLFDLTMNMLGQDIFSLEDDDCNDLFITQESTGCSQLEILSDDSENESFLGLNFQDFSSPNVSVVKGLEAIYSNISDTDNFQEPSQKHQKIE